MANVRLDAYDRDFEFVADGHRYPCPAFFAEFHSPAVSRFRQTDPTLSTFSIGVSGIRGLFHSVFALCRGSEVSVSTADVATLISMFSALGNGALVESIFRLHGGDCVNDDNVVDRLRLKSMAGISVNQEAAYLAGRFDQLPDSILVALSVTDLREILVHPLLRLKSEESLLAFMLSRIESRLEFAELLPLVRFEFLSNASFGGFISWSADHLEVVNGELWASVWRRLALYPPLLPHSSSVRHATAVRDHSNDPQASSSLQFKQDEMPIERFPFLYGIVASLKCRLSNHLKVRSSSIHAPVLHYDDKYATSVSPCNGFASVDGVSELHDGAMAGI
jgi:hypothetical protein